MCGQVVQCKGCDSIETYELSPAASLPLSAEIIRFGLLAQLRKSQGQDDAQYQLPDTPLIRGTPQLMAGGRRFNTIGAAYHYLKQELDKHPTSAELHRRLANVLKNGDRPDLALPYYYKAIALDPGESEGRPRMAPDDRREHPQRDDVERPRGRRPGPRRLGREPRLPRLPRLALLSLRPRPRR